MLMNSGQAVKDSTYEMTVALYTDPSGTSPLWSDRFEAQTSGGTYALTLGSGAPLPPSSKLDQPLWVGITIDGIKMLPLTQFTTTPFALNIADGAITAKKLNTDYVSEISVEGVKATGKGTPLNLASCSGIELRYDEESRNVIIGAVEQQENTPNSAVY